MCATEIEIYHRFSLKIKEEPKRLNLIGLRNYGVHNIIFKFGDNSKNLMVHLVLKY